MHGHPAPRRRGAPIRLTRAHVPPIAVGVIVALLLLPWSGVDTDPPRCTSLLGYGVPCTGGWPVVAGVLAGLLVVVVRRARRLGGPS